MKKFILKFLLLIFSFVNAQNTDLMFDTANQHYQKEAYTNALKIYKDIVDSGFVSSSLYFNMGNVYFKTNKIAEAVYYYEKALQLNANNTDAQQNLTIVQKSTIDSIDEVPKSIFQKINDQFLAVFSYNDWAKITVIFCFLGTVLWLLFFFSVSPALKKLFFTLSVFVTVLTSVSLGITYQQHNYINNSTYAIVFSNRVEVKNAPRTSANDVFNLHLGTKVKVLDIVGDWKKIKIADGQVGWLPKSNIKEL